MIYHSFGENETIAYINVIEEDIIIKDGEKYIKIRNVKKPGKFHEIKISNDMFDKLLFNEKNKIKYEWNSNFVNDNNVLSVN